MNGKDQGVGNKQGGYIDSPPNNNPVLDVTSKSIECNVAGVKASKSINVAGGDELTFQWYHDTNSASDDIIASVCQIMHMSMHSTLADLTSRTRDPLWFTPPKLVVRCPGRSFGRTRAPELGLWTSSLLEATLAKRASIP